MATQTKKKINREKCRAITPEFRVAYPHVFKPQAPKSGDKLKYSVVMLFPKDSDLTVIKGIIKEAKLAAFGAKENWPEVLESPVKDGDDEKYAGNEGYKGHWVIKASSNEEQKPGVVDQNVEPILSQSDFYPGCYARAQVLATNWEYMGKQGIMFILDHVQKTRDGKAFGGKKPADQVFTPVNAGDTEESGDDADAGF
jgi:hypothetical protein